MESAGLAATDMGKPGALEAIPGTAQAESGLAALTGCERVVLGTSTLHLFSDLFAMLAGRRVAIWVDEATYPIARWGTDRAAVSGVPVRLFRAHDPAMLRRAVGSAPGTVPVIVADGYCPLRGQPSPLREYAECAAAAGGLLIVDDTQALGVLGRQVGGGHPFGAGGGGSLRHFDLGGPHVVVVSSLAKAFGAPVAMLGGCHAMAEEFRERSATLVHCSQPSAASVAATLRALEINRRSGDALRRRLAARVMRFRRAIPDLMATGSLFPVQPLRLAPQVDAREVYQGLAARGIRPVLLRDRASHRPRISFVLTASHQDREIDRALEGLLAAGARGRWKKERSQRQCFQDTLAAFDRAGAGGAPVVGVG